MIFPDIFLNFIEYSLSLIQFVCVIAVIAYFFSRTSIFRRVIHHCLTLPDQVIILLFFGILSVYGTMTRIWLLGAEVNILDLGPMVGGLFAGPVGGIGAGIIGGLFRYSLGGVAAEACSLTALIAGCLGALVWYLNKRTFLPLHLAVLFAIGIEVIHDILALLLIHPLELSIQIVSQLTLPVTLANTAGVAIFAIIIHNRMNEEVTKTEHDILEAEIYRRDVDLRAARQIQERFLPQDLPQIDTVSISPVSIPALDVGGDFYDLIYPMKESLIGLVVADVSGKGVPAALFMGLSKTLTWANLVREDSLSDAITEANRMIKVNSTAGMFVTLWCGLLDPISYELTYVNCGHPPPIVIKPDGRIVLLTKTGIALGVIETLYSAEQITLGIGDLLILYTDGVTEAVDTQDQQYGLERLIQVVQTYHESHTSDIVQKVLDDLAVYTSGTEQFDDITLVVIRVS